LLIRSISGLRGLTAAHDGLTDEVVHAYASAFAATRGNDGIVAIGYDGRHGGQRLYDLVTEVLIHKGCDVLALGMVPTPTVMFAVEKNDTVRGGISITASHNGQEWNGMKLIASTGLFLDQVENEYLWSIVDGKSQTPSPKRGELVNGEYIIHEHIDSILAIPFLNRQAIAEREFRIVFDAVNASGSLILPLLFEKLGIKEVIKIAADGSGTFPHRPEPVPENLQELCAAVNEYQAHLGIAVDPDADRCVLITEHGEPFIEENTIVLAVEEVLRHASTGQHVVVNLSTTRAVEDIAAEFDATVHRTPVGEINVAKKMREVGAIIGGEGSGGVIYPGVHTGRDSLVAVALALSNLATSGLSASEKKKALPQYEIVKSKIELESRSQVSELLAKIKAKLSADATAISEADGLRLEFGNTWLHVRASNTEPIIRLIAEAPTREEASELIAKAQS
jgi:phosphomannomutase